MRGECHELSKARLSRVAPGTLRTLEAFTAEARETREEMLEKLEKFSDATIAAADGVRRRTGQDGKVLRDFSGARLPLSRVRARADPAVARRPDRSVAKRA